MLCSIILETDANVIAGKVASHSVDAGAPLSEQVIILWSPLSKPPVSLKEIIKIVKQTPFLLCLSR